MLEIERKFLVKNSDFKKEAKKVYQIKQGYLNSNPNRSVRIRIKADKGFLTIKGISNEKGTSRFEWEKDISLNEAEKLFELCERGTIEKNRYEVVFEKHIFEVDEFFNENEGLVIAEIELEDENEQFEKPNWLGEEVTGIAKYYNSNLSKMPFVKW